MWGEESEYERQKRYEEEQRELVKRDVERNISGLQSARSNALYNGDQDRIDDIDRAIEYERSRVY